MYCKSYHSQSNLSVGLELIWIVASTTGISIPRLVVETSQYRFDSNPSHAAAGRGKCYASADTTTRTKVIIKQ